MPSPFLHKDLKITSQFGQRTIQGKTEFHKGVDLSCYYENLYCPEICIIKRIGYDDLSGNYITIQITDGRKISFCHLSSSNVITEEHYRENDLIGVTGESGRCFGAHLHVTMFDVNGNRIDPTQYIQSCWDSTPIPQLAGIGSNLPIIVAVIITAILLTGVIK